MEHIERADREVLLASAGGGLAPLRSGGEPDKVLHRLRRVAYYLFASAAVLALGGCVRETVDGATREFSYSLWMPLTFIGAGILVAGAGIAMLMARKNGPVDTSALWLMAFGVMAACFLGPIFLGERVSIDDSSFRVRTMEGTYEVKLDDVLGVRIIEERETVRGKPGMIKRYVVCECVGGKIVKIPIWGELEQAAWPHFLKKISDRGILIRDET